jgi:hypothetical protein
LEGSLECRICACADPPQPGRDAGQPGRLRRVGLAVSAMRLLAVPEERRGSARVRVAVQPVHRQAAQAMGREPGHALSLTGVTVPRA